MQRGSEQEGQTETERVQRIANIGGAMNLMYKDTTIKTLIDAEKLDRTRITVHIPLYFLDQTKRVFAPGYVCNNDDLLRCRVKTTGMNEVVFSHKTLKFKEN